MLTILERTIVARKAIENLGARRARDGQSVNVPPEPNKTGFDGVDQLPSGSYRARIRFCNALTGEDTRLSLGAYKSAEAAGLAYRSAHLHLWGALSYFVGEVAL